MQAEGRCIQCGKEAVVPCYCQEHHEKRRLARMTTPTHCSRCGKSGHNKRTCKEPESLTEDSPIS